MFLPMLSPPNPPPQVTYVRSLGGTCWELPALPKPKEMKYAHKFHIVFMIFLFRLSFCSFLFFPCSVPRFSCLSSSFLAFFSFSALHFYWFPNGFWRLPTHTHISLGIGYSVLQVLKLELGNGVRSTYLPISPLELNLPHRTFSLLPVHRFVVNAFH